MDKRTGEYKERETNGVAKDMSAMGSKMQSNLSKRPELQGWITFVGGSLLVLFAIGYFSFVKYIIMAVGVFFIFQGAAQAHLIEKIQNLYHWIKSKF